MVKEEHAGLLGGPTTSPTPGSPRWRQSREENRKWETAAQREGPGWRIGWRGAQPPTQRQADRRSDGPPGGPPGPPSLPPVGGPPRGSAPRQRWGSGRPVPPGEGPWRGGKTRRGGPGAGTDSSSGEGESPAAPEPSGPGARESVGRT